MRLKDEKGKKKVEKEISWKFKYLKRDWIVGNGEENDIGEEEEILKRKIEKEEKDIEGVVEIVENNEIMKGWKLKEEGVIENRIRGKIKSVIGKEIGKSIKIELKGEVILSKIRIVDSEKEIEIERIVVDIEKEEENMKKVERKEDKEIDVIEGSIDRKFEKKKVEEIRIRDKDKERKEIKEKRKRIERIEIGIFRKEKVIELKKSGENGEGRNDERMEKKGEDNKRKEKRMKDKDDGLEKEKGFFSLVIDGKDNCI